MSAAPRINGLKVVEAEPGAPPPEGVPPWALRCQVEEKPAYPIALQPWILGAGIAGILGGVLTTVYVSHWGFAPVPLSLVALYYGLRPPTSTVVRPAADGWYLAFDDTVPDPGADEGNRAIALIFGVVALAVAGLLLFRQDGPDWEGIGLIGGLALGCLYYGVTGRDPRSDDPPVPPATAEFRALADPARPIADGAQVSGPRLPTADQRGDPQAGS